MNPINTINISNLFSKTCICKKAGNLNLRDCLLMGILALLFVYICFVLYRYIGGIFNPFVNEYREYAQIDAIKSFVNHSHPYPSRPDLETMYLYGPLYPLLCAWMADIVFFLTDIWQKISSTTPNTTLLPDLFLISRTVSALCSLCTALIGSIYVYRACKGSTQPLLSIIFAAMTFIWLLKTNWVLGIYGVANPGALGSLLLILTIIAALRNKLFLAAAFTVLSFYTKAYFCIIAFPILIYLLLNNRKGLYKYIVSGILLTALSLYICLELWPNSFIYMFYHHIQMAGPCASYEILLNQLYMVTRLCLPMILGILILIVKDWRLLRTNIFLLCALGLFLPWLRLAMHAGSFMVYFFQLWYIPFIIFAFSELPVKIKNTRILTCFVYITLGWIMITPLHYAFNPSFDTVQPRYALLKNKIDHLASDSTISLSPLTASLAEEKGMLNLDNGQTQYIGTLKIERKNFLDRILYPKIEDTNWAAVNFRKEFVNLISEKQYKFVLTDKNSACITTSQLINASYIISDSIQYNDGVQIYIWEKQPM